MMADHDLLMIQSRKWSWHKLNLQRKEGSRQAWFVESVRSKIFEQGLHAGIKTFAGRSYVRGFTRIQKLAESEPADWFIAHTQGALPIAAAAARRFTAKLGFDCEDLLSELGNDDPNIIRLIETQYLPKCDYISTPSKAVSNRLIELYAVKPSPIVLYNVFPLSLAAGMRPPNERAVARPLRLHWFGQTIGQGRGLEEAIEAAGLLRCEVEIHLRGRVAEAYRLELSCLAKRAGDRVKLIFHPVVNHDQLVMTMDQFDIGLALENPENGGYSRTVTNKLFTYLLAGLAIVATDTPGQREVLAQIPSAGFLYPSGKPELLINGLARWANDRVALKVAQQAAWNSARERFCWDIEQRAWLDLFAQSSRFSVPV